MKKNEIIAVVRSGDTEYIVLREKVDTEYIQLDSKTIVGISDPFLKFYERDWMGSSGAFGGRKFDLTMCDGTVVHCTGQWWDSISETAARELKLDFEQRRVVGVAAASIDQLRNCYVFFGYNSLAGDWQKFRATYDGPVYEYREYEKMIKTTTPLK